MPALEARLDRFANANTQPVGASVDSRFCHANWAASLGGIRFPLLADFHPKGELGNRYKLYLPNDGVDDRATVLIDAAGIVRYARSVSVSGERDMDALAALCEAIDREYEGALTPCAQPLGIRANTRVFVRDDCAASASVLLALRNLHLEDRVRVCNVTRSQEDLEELRRLAGTVQAPCLVDEDEPVLESAAIIRRLALRETGL